MARDILSNMGTKNNYKETRKEKINRLVQELEKEKDNVNQLRTTIDVMHAGWSLDKVKLSEATERLNEKVIKVGLQENVIEENKTSLKRRITTRSVSLKKMCKGGGTSTNDLSVRKTSKGLISCPLCCNESFPTEEALKYHLRSVFENVFCPLCSQKCKNVTCLISHLEIGCDRVLTCEQYPEMSFDSLFSDKQINTERSSDKTITLPQNTLAIVSIKPPDLQSDQGESLNGLCIVGENIETTSMAFSDKINTSNAKPDLPMQTFTEEIQIKQEETDTSASVDSDVEEVMEQHSEISLSDDESDRNNDNDSEEESTTNEDEPAESEEYVCSACNMSFTSLIPHIQEYHAGEQVKIMGAPEELRKKLQLTCGKEVNIDKDPVTGPNLEDSNSQKNPPNDSLSKSSNEQIEEKNNDVQKGYWAKQGQCYNFVNNEEKMKLLYPSFEPPKTKLNTSLGINTRPRWTKLLDKLELIQIVDDKILLGGASQYHINIYIVDENKARDKKNLGPVAKVIPILHRSKVKISESDEEFDDSTKSEINKSSDETNIQRRCNQYIQVLKVPLGKDKEITIENVNFDFLPPVPENVVPYLDNVTNPEIPLLKGAKQLKWHCELCLTPVTTVFNAVRRHNCYKCKYCEKGFRKNIKVFMQHVLVNCITS